MRIAVSAGLVACVCLVLISPAVVAQEPAPPPAAGQEPAPPPTNTVTGDAESRPFGGGRMARLGRYFFESGPEDQGPLQPGEEEELLEFAQERMPQFYKLMNDLRQRNPERFRAKFADQAPRLRHLRRVYERNPRIGRVIQAHAENMFRIKRDLRTLRDLNRDSALYASTLDATRARVAENVRLELEALKILAAEWEAERDQRLEDRLNRLLSDEGDQADVPPALRELVASYRAADPAEREQVRARVRQGVLRMLNGELEALRTRTADMEAHIEAETDRRMERLLESR